MIVFVGEAFGKRLGNDGGALMHGISAVIRDLGEFPQPILPCEHTQKEDHL